MKSAQHPIHVIIDTDALEIFSDKNLYAQTLIPNLCDRLGFRLHVLNSRLTGYLAYGYPSTNALDVIHCRSNESCTCSRHGCIRDAVLSVIDTDAFLIAIVAAPDSICLASYADRIFATGMARNACEERQYPHHPVVQWTDVERIIMTLATGNRFTPRRQARLQRMDAFKSE